MKRFFTVGLLLLATVAAASSCAPKPPRHTLLCALPARFQHTKMVLPRIEVSVERDGSVLWNGSNVDWKTLQSYFTDLGSMDPQYDIYIVVRDPQTPYIKVAPVLRLMREKNAYRLGIASQHTQNLPPIGLPVPIAVGCGLFDTALPEPRPEDVVDIAEDGGTRWNGAAISHEWLRKELDRAARSNPQPLIMLKIDPHTPFPMVSDVMFDIQDSGIAWMRFETD